MTNQDLIKYAKKLNKIADKFLHEKDLNPDFLTVKITVDDDNYSIISVIRIDQDPNIYRITTYDNGASSHRLREELKFKDMQSVKKWLIEDNRYYDLNFNYTDTIIYY